MMEGMVYRRYVLLASTFVYGVSFCDSNFIILLLQPIKEDLHLSDSELGFLTGIASAVCYTTLGLPFGLWSDRHNRVNIASAAVGLWGLTVMSYVWVQNYAQLLLARVVATVGQAGCGPPTYSLVGDYYPAPTERVSAMATYMLASPLSSLVCFGFGGWLAEIVGWRRSLFFMGIPGVIAACLVKLTVVDPRVQKIAAEKSGRGAQAGLVEILGRLWLQRSTRHLVVAIVCLFTVGNGLAAWYGAFLMRSHGVRPAELGLWFGLIFGVGGASGILLGRYVTRRWFAEDEPGQMRFSAIVTALLLGFVVTFVFAPQKPAALLSLAALVIASSVFYGPAFALIQRLVTSDARATTLSIVLLFANLIGLGLGPQLVGITSDALSQAVGQADALRYAMLALSITALASAHQFWRVSYSIKDDLERVALSERSVSRV